jgi:hypothetical protein
VRTVAIVQQPALHPEHVVASVSMARAPLATSFGYARSMRVTLRFWRAHWNPTFVLLRAHGVASSVAHWENARSCVRLWYAFMRSQRYCRLFAGGDRRRDAGRRID